VILAFVDRMRASGHAVESIVAVLRLGGLKIAARTLRTWNSDAQQVSDRTLTHAHVEDIVRELAYRVRHDGRKVLAPEGLYGRRKMLALVRRRNPAATRGAVEAAMRTLGLSGVVRGRRHRTTFPNPADPRPEDLLERNFAANAPDLVWVADFTYVRTHTVFTYVSFVVDCFAQKIVGWNASIRHDTELVELPVRMALWQRENAGTPVERGRLIAHSDAGSEYTSLRYSERLDFEGIRPSIGSVGDAFDNALMESINGLYKTECVRADVFHEGPFHTLEDVEFATAAWVEWYNHRRLH
jgi:putative transposase